MSRRRSVVVQESSTTGWLTVYSPYHAEFVRRARAMGGRWYEGAWHFGPHLAEAVAVLLDEAFPGWDAQKKSIGRDARPDRSPVAADEMAGTGSGSRPASADQGTRRG